MKTLESPLSKFIGTRSPKINATSLPTEGQAMSDRSRHRRLLDNKRCGCSSHAQSDIAESDHLPAPLLEQALEQVDVAPHPVQVGVDIKCAARILERAVVILEARVDQGVAGECAEVIRVALH